MLCVRALAATQICVLVEGGWWEQLRKELGCIVTLLEVNLRRRELVMSELYELKFLDHRDEMIRDLELLRSCN